MKKSFSFENQCIEGLERIPPEYFGECMDMTFRFETANEALIAVFVRGVLIVYNPHDNMLLLPNGMFPVNRHDGRAEFRVITDRCSVEIYWGDGLFNTVLGTVPDPNDITVKVVSLDPSVAVDFEIHKLGSSWADVTLK